MDAPGRPASAGDIWGCAMGSRVGTPGILVGIYGPVGVAVAVEYFVAASDTPLRNDPMPLMVPPKAAILP